MAVETEQMDPKIFWQFLRNIQQDAGTRSLIGGSMMNCCGSYACKQQMFSFLATQINQPSLNFPSLNDFNFFPILLAQISLSWHFHNRQTCVMEI